MNRLSPGATATTSLFMVLTLVAMGVLVLRDDAPPPSCEERLERMGNVRWDPEGPIPHPGERITATFSYTVTADGTITDIERIGSATPYDDVARQALEGGRYSPAESEQRCRYSIELSID